MELDSDGVAAVFPPMQERGASRSRAGGRLVLVHLSSERTPKPVRKTAPLPRSRSLTLCACASSEGGASSMSPPHLLARNRQSELRVRGGWRCRLAMHRGATRATTSGQRSGSLPGVAHGGQILLLGA